jgi:hypothetical protein
MYWGSHWEASGRSRYMASGSIRIVFGLLSVLQRDIFTVADVQGSVHSSSKKVEVMIDLRNPVTKAGVIQVREKISLRHSSGQ